MDGVEAMRLFRELRPDAVLLDVNLPGMDGLDVLRAIRDEGQTPVIIVTALADDVDKLLGLRGRDDYVVKPFNPPSRGARLRAAARAGHANAAPIRVGGIEIDEQDHVAVAHVGGGRLCRCNDADRVPPAGLPGIPAAALLLARIPDRALLAGKRRA